MHHSQQNALSTLQSTAGRRPLILVSNDDGITAKGIAHLVEAVKGLGEVVVVAPDSPQSGMGHAITVHGSIKLRPSNQFGPDVLAYECSGTPADCVKLAKRHVLKGRTPDLVVSGINHGANSSISIIYSGTMSAAMEAAIEWVPAIGFSLCEFGADAYFDHAQEHVTYIANRVLQDGLPKGVVLNVNIPAHDSAKPIQGYMVCRQGDGFWAESFLPVEGHVSENGEEEVLLEGVFVNRDQAARDTDTWALENGYISIVPAQYDLTAYNQLETMRENWGRFGMGRV